MCGRQASGFVIQSLDGSCTLESPCLIECNDLPSNRSEIPSPTVAENYSHLADIAPQIPTIDDGVEIELLLGRDLVCAHHVLEQRISGDMLPFGQRLPLGWVIIGNVCLGQAHLPEQVNVRKTTVFANGRPSYLEPCESELTVKEDPIFKRVPGDEKPGLSLEDKRFLDIMRTGFQRTTSGHWEAPMPFKENRPFLPNNKRMALKRAKSFDISLSSNPDKRRKVLEFMEKLLRFAQPFTICGKLLLREMMSVTTSNEWDDPLPESLYGKWCTWVDSMHHLGNLSIPRAYCDISFADALKREVLVFADASKDVIAAVAYLKLYDADRSKIGFLLGKAKLAPTHGHTIPRLELCAAVLATEIAEIVRDQLDIQRDAFQFFSDSQVVLGYISNESRRFYIYVGNRVSKIRLFSKPSQWSFVHSECNPADIATRGLDASSLSQSKWILGPDIEQTTSDNFDLVDPDNDKEIRPEVRCFKLEHSEENTEHLVGRTKQSEDITDSSEDKVERSAEISEVFSERFSRFSDWRKLVRVVARIKFLATSVRKDRKCLAERFDEPRLLQESERVIIKLAQHDAFSTELKCIYEGKDIPHSSSLGILCPFIDANGQLRVGGRLNKISDDVIDLGLRNPIILPKDHHVTLQNSQSLGLSYASYQQTNNIETGPPLVILHGLMGSKANWHSISKVLSRTGRQVIAVDARNHGESPHSPNMNFSLMSKDLIYLLDELEIDTAVLMGHSMGGKTAMVASLTESDRVDSLIVADVSPTRSPGRTLPNLLDCMLRVQLAMQDTYIPLSAAKQKANVMLEEVEPNKEIREFLVTNLVQKENGVRWQINLDSIINNRASISDFPQFNEQFHKPTLFIGGRLSPYIREIDLPEIEWLFPNAVVQYIEGAGHWVHSDKPAAFVDIVKQFLTETRH
ncbi:hypothetical protein ScPMuIL_006458 [Solemya velum]